MKTRKYKIIAIITTIVCAAIIGAGIAWLVIINKNQCSTNSKNENAICMTTDDGRERCWLKISPPSKQGDEPIPLVVHMHGYSMCADTLYSNYTQWENLAAEEGFMIIFPQGLERIKGAKDKKPSWNAGLCCPGATEKKIDDVSFLRSLVETEVANKANNIDASRVYVSGHSNGCAMAQRMAVEASDLFAAVGCHSFYLLAEVPNSYDPIPFIEVHGEDDETVPYEDTVWPETTSKVGAVDNLKTWSRINECAQDDPVFESSNGYTTTTYNNCTNGATVSLVSIPIAGHFPYLNLYQPDVLNKNKKNTKLNLDTTTMVWDFMKEFSKQNTTSSSAD